MGDHPEDGPLPDLSLHERLIGDALPDADLDLPALGPDVPVEAVLEYRRDHADELTEVRAHLVMLSAAGLAAGAGTAVLTIFAAPVTPIVLAIAGLSLVSGSAIPGVALVNSWREGKAVGHENGFSYLLHV